MAGASSAEASSTSANFALRSRPTSLSIERTTASPSADFLI